MFAQANEAARATPGRWSNRRRHEHRLDFWLGLRAVPGRGAAVHNAYGPENFVKRSKELAKKYGERSSAAVIVKYARTAGHSRRCEGCNRGRRLIFRDL